MRRSTAVVTSVGWFAVTAGIGAVLVPWWLTSWRLPHPLPYGGVPGTLGMVLIVAGLIPAVRAVRAVRAGRRDADARRDDQATGGDRGQPLRA